MADARSKLASAVAIIALLLLLVGSWLAHRAGSSASPGSQASPTIQPTSPVPVPTTPEPATQFCALSDLKISLDSGAIGVAAGSSFDALEFDNVSASPCTLPAFPAVAFAASPQGPQVGAPAVRQGQPPTQEVVLAAGQSAHAWLQKAAAASFPAASCHPTGVGGLRVSLTGTEGGTFVPDAVTACARQPGDSAVLSVFPIEAGPAIPGTAP